MFRHKFQFEFALRKYLELKMSARSVQMDSEASSQSSDSGQESGPLNSRENQSKETFSAGMDFQCTLQTDLLGVTTHEKNEGRHDT